MALEEFFSVDDGSLPEVDVELSDPALVPIAFKHLYERGARNVTVSGGYLWIKASESEKPFSGYEDAHLVTSGAAEPFHVVLGGIAGSSSIIPDLGVFVFVDSIGFDYRMGAEWGKNEIQSFLELLNQLRALGGKISVPWWGPVGEQEFLAALNSF